MAGAAWVDFQAAWVAQLGWIGWVAGFEPSYAFCHRKVQGYLRAMGRQSRGPHERWSQTPPRPGSAENLKEQNGPDTDPKSTLTLAEAFLSHASINFHLIVPASSALHWCEGRNAMKAFARRCLRGFRIAAYFSMGSYENIGFKAPRAKTMTINKP